MAEGNGLTVFDHPTTAKLVEICLPLIDAFEAGLFLFRITPSEVVCVPQPSLSIENGRLHRADGPAVRWPSGEAYHFRRGVPLPPWVIEGSSRITAQTIQAEPAQEVRPAMTEIMACRAEAGPSDWATRPIVAAMPERVAILLIGGNKRVSEAKRKQQLSSNSILSDATWVTTMNHCGRSDATS